MNPLNVGSLEACQRLQEKGIVLETEAKWIIWPTGLIELVGRAEYRDADVSVCPAPSMAEVWRELPESIKWRGTWRHLTIEKIGDVTSAYYRTNGIPSNETNPTDALIDLLIWTVEQGKEKV
jgi:hypothetical protein